MCVATNRDYEQTQTIPVGTAYDQTQPQMPAASPRIDSSAQISNFYSPQNDGYMEVAVSDPILVKQQFKDFHAYPIVGRDSLGDFECQRRFNHFYEFRLALVLRYPGLYIPPLPPKKLSGKGEEITLIERTHFINLFLKECVEHKYIAQSVELQSFLRPTEDLAKILDKLKVKIGTSDQIVMMRATINVDEVSLKLT